MASASAKHFALPHSNAVLHLAAVCFVIALLALHATAAGERIVKSIAPSIYGHQNIKQGIALALFGG